jgi:alpha-tubulin suppressor-like RCC1 family protein
VFATGLNENGQLGIGRLGRESVPSRVVVLEKITDVAAGRAHSLFLTQGGEVYAAGDNTCAQLGLGHRKRLAAPVKIAVFENVPNLKVKKIAAGGKHSAAVT